MNVGQLYQIKRIKCRFCLNKNAIVNVWKDVADQLNFTENNKFLFWVKFRPKDQAGILLNLLLKLKGIFSADDFLCKPT